MSDISRSAVEAKRAEDGESAPTGKHRRDDGSLVVPGVLVTSGEVVHWIPGVGRARLRLQISEAQLRGWGIDSLPLLRDHGDDGDWFVVPGLKHTIGQIENLHIADAKVRGEFVFDPDLAKLPDGRDLIGPVERGNLRDISVGFSATELELVEQKENELPLYEATQWAPHEGSLVWAGADSGAKLERSKKMDPEQLAALITNAVRAALPATPDSTPTTAINSNGVQESPVRSTPAASPAVPATPTLDEITDVASNEFGVTRAQELVAQANGNPDTLRQLVRLERSQKKKPAPSPPVKPPAREIDVGMPGASRALGDMVTVLLARGNVSDEYTQAAQKVHADWRSMSAGILIERFARATDPSLSVVTSRTQLVEGWMRRSRMERPAGALLRDGGFYYRDASLGLVPADLPSAFQDVVRKTLMANYDREVLDFSRYARRQDVIDFRKQRMIWVDVAGQFDPLAKEEQLRKVTLRELEGEFHAELYGHFHKISYHAIVNDDLGVIITVPAMLGRWMAAGENKVFQLVIRNGTNFTGNSVWTGDQDIVAADPTEFATHLEVARMRALGTEPVPRAADEDPKNDPHKTRALIPDVMLYGSAIDAPWYQFMAERNRRTFDTPANTLRRPYLERLWQRSGEGLYLPAPNYYIWPGPESPFCPLTWGRIIGQDLRVELRDTDAREPDGLITRATDTFGVSFNQNNKAYRIGPPAA